MTIPLERLLSMSAFTPLIQLRQFLLTNEGMSALEVVGSLRVVDESFAASDHDAALYLHEQLHPNLHFGDWAMDMRKALSHLLLANRPPWTKRVQFGRKVFLAGRDNNTRQCFEAALLLEEVPDADAIRWWDELDNKLRAMQNFDMVQQGRAAELLSMDHERGELKKLGIVAEPKWKAIDDNTLGYDILSFRPGAQQPTNLLIEVKSSSRTPPVVVLSRNEWEKALEFGKSFLFHLWDMGSKQLLECSVESMQHHMPVDQGGGEWTNVAVPLNALRR